ncbi:serine hydrolase FSH [Phlyctochytrium arcticum]|nr:serine hydrolase FSH [Phlyctochytrium arcticum]
MAERLRILCLHGYTQNADVFRKRIAVVTKDLKKLADFVFISAPHSLPDETPQSEFSRLAIPEGEGQRAWWISEGDGTEYVGVDKSLDYIESVWKSQGPFDGLFGFSQGATMAALVASYLDPAPRFSFHVSGFIPRAKTQLELLDRLSPKLPSLHVIGNSDSWVAPERSEQLATKFGPSKKVMFHDGGHFIPTSAEHRRQYREFVEEFIRQ